MPFQRKSQVRLTILSVLLILLLLFYAGRMYKLQIKARSEADNPVAGTTVRTAVLKAPRGEILDCYGRKIAVNRDGYNIVFNKAYVGDDLNDVILALIQLMQNRKLEWIDRLPISDHAPYTFSAEESHDKLLRILGVAHYATAENCFVQMVKKYDLESYSPEEQRLLAGVRYSMDAADFSISYPYTFAEDIPNELMRTVTESGFLFGGVTVDVVPFREYPDTSLAVNLIGEVGPIYAEDWDDPDGANYKKRGYSFNDKVGKSGIEYWAEEYLHGTDGEIAYYIDAKGNIVSSKVTVQPVAGKTVMLTLDRSLQRTAQDALAATVKDLQAHGGTVTAGSVVIERINSGGVLCAANYPSYDSATMHENYSKLLSDPAKPLTNRAFQGVYPIGSTIKPAVSVAALENGKYHLGETIFCKRTYDYFDDYKPHCMHYHGSMVLKTALAKSCNYFYFELGKRVGAVRLTDYFQQFGLGVKTGIEVDDSAGILAVPKNNGFGGDTLQIAIGQKNAFTPLQLCNYCATLANGGTHYRATLIDKITSYDLSEIYDNNEPEVVNTVKISNRNLAAIKEGMLSVTVDGTGRATLSDYPLKIGGKTGTSEVDHGADHTTFILFAPYENPEIAISVVLEHGSSTNAAGTLLRQLLDAYFFDTTGNVKDFSVNTVLP